MTDFTIEALGAAAAPAGTDLVEVYQGADPSKKMALSALESFVLTDGTAQSSDINLNGGVGNITLSNDSGNTSIDITSEGAVGLNSTNGSLAFEANGDAFISGGNATIILTLPTADPNVAGQWWSNLGIITVSAG